MVGRDEGVENTGRSGGGDAGRAEVVFDRDGHACECARALSFIHFLRDLQRAIVPDLVQRDRLATRLLCSVDPDIGDDDFVVDGHFHHVIRIRAEGVFAGGDARRTLVKQAVISAADGCIAALGAEKHVNKRTQMRPQYS